MIDLHLFKIDDGESHSVIAADEDDALRVVIEFGGVVDISTPAEYRASITDLTITKFDDSHVLSVTYDDDRDAAADGAEPGSLKVRRTAREWIDGSGRSYLGGSFW